MQEAGHEDDSATESSVFVYSHRRTHSLAVNLPEMSDAVFSRGLAVTF